MARIPRQYLLPLSSGAIMVFAYAPFSIPLLPFVGLVPFFLFLDRPLSWRQVHWGGWAFALPYFVGNIYWMFYLGGFTSAGIPGGIGTLVLHFATFFTFPISVSILRHALRLPLPLIVPFAWTVSEHARAYGDFYFPWVTLGYSLSEWPLLVQHADLIGVYGISWWLALVNALIATMLRSRRKSFQLRVLGTALVAALLLPIAYNTARWRTIEKATAAAPTLRVAAIQPNVAQGTKWNPDSVAMTFSSVNRLIAAAEGSAPDLVVGPEACLPMVLHTSSRRLPGKIAPGSRPLLLGAVTGKGERVEQRLQGRTTTMYREHYNSALLAGPQRLVIGRHDKQYLVPITEQIPYKKAFGFLLPFMRAQFGRFLPAEDLRLLSLPADDRPVQFGALICYESLFPGLVRRMRGMGAQFLVNITNDAWFGNSSMPYQHAGFCVLRAIENRCAIVRSANTGISAFYDPLGRIGPRSALFEKTVLTGEVPLTEGLTFYARWGDLLLYLSYLALAVGFGLAWKARKGSR